MLSNLEIIGWKKFRGEPKLDEAAGQVQFGCQRNFLNSVISKLDKHVVLLLINYIAREVIQLCKEHYSKCLWRKTDWALDLPKLGKASKISGDLGDRWRLSQVFENPGKCSGDPRKSSGDLRKSSEVFGRSSEVLKRSLQIFGDVRVIFGNLRNCSGNLRKSLEVFERSSEIFGSVRVIFGNLREVSCGLR